MLENNESAAGTVTRLLGKWCKGDAGALDALIEAVSASLNRLARGRLSCVERGTYLETKHLINDAVMKVSKIPNLDFGDREHFFGLMSGIMRWIVLDDLKRRGSIRRQGNRVQTEEWVLPVQQNVEMTIDLVDALGKLEAEHPTVAACFWARCVMGCSPVEIAGEFGLSERTISRKVKFARALLHKELKGR